MSLENPFEKPQEQLPPPRSPEERIEHLRALEALVQKTGFTETESMKAVRESSVETWAQQGMRLIDTDQSDQQNSMKLELGFQIALAAIYYERGDHSAYCETLNDAERIALFLHTEDADEIYWTLKAM